MPGAEAPAPVVEAPAPPVEGTLGVPPIVAEATDPMLGLLDTADTMQSVEKTKRLRSAVKAIGRGALHLADATIAGAVNLKEAPSLAKDALQLRKDRKIAKQLDRFGATVDTTKLTYKYEVDDSGEFVNNVNFSSAESVGDKRVEIGNKVKDTTVAGAEFASDKVKSAGRFTAEKTKNGARRTKDVTVRGAVATAEGVKSAGRFTAEKTKNGARRTKDVTVRGAVATAEGVKSAGRFTAEKTVNGKNRVVDATLETRATVREKVAKRLSERRATKAEKRLGKLDSRIAAQKTAEVQRIEAEKAHAQQMIEAQMARLAQLQATEQGRVSTVEVKAAPKREATVKKVLSGADRVQAHARAADALRAKKRRTDREPAVV